MAICVAGPGALEAMVQLCRDGFERVECARRATCVGADETHDVLMIDGAAGETELAILIGATVRLLRDDGVLAVRSCGPSAQRAVGRAITAAGFSIMGAAHTRGATLTAVTVARTRRLALAG